MFGSKDQFEKRKNIIEMGNDLDSFKLFISDFISFYKSLSLLISLNGHIIMFVTPKGKFIMKEELINSVVFTLNSIKICAEYGSIADINSLVRKISDDLFLYLYFNEVHNNHNSLGDDVTEQEENTIMWMNDELRDLGTGTIIKYLGENDSIEEVIKKHDLKKVWDKIRENLNDYIHTNGRSFAQKNYIKNINYKKYFKEIKYHLKFISIVFLVLLILIKPQFISSTDYMNALEIGKEPEEGSQYIVAPFIQDFINKYINEFDFKLKEFLIDNTYMDIK